MSTLSEQTHLPGLHPAPKVPATTLLSDVLVLVKATLTSTVLVPALNAIVGAVPGALPPVIAWAAARGETGVESWVLFTILFLWQMPHFLAISWLYREDYRRAGFRMLSSQDTECRLTGRLAFLYSMGLMSVSLLPYVLRLTPFWYVPLALVTGSTFSVVAFVFFLHGTERAARRLFLMSILYLPVTLGCLVLARA